MRADELPRTGRTALRELGRRLEVRRLFGGDARLIPPVELMHDGPATYREFRDNGKEFLRVYVELCGLRPDERMLDVGSGIGRKTAPLTHYLDSRGSYVGLDIVRSGVEWCTAKYSRRYPNFRFQLIDVRNDAYNPTGAHDASEYKFPFSANEFDFVVLNSVFTHMLPSAVENYLGEIARVLRPGGRCLISWFLLNEESLGLIADGKSTLDLRHEIGPARAISAERPEDAIGYDETYVVAQYARVGLDLRGRSGIHHGSWPGRTDFYSYQDQVLAFKPA